MCDTTPALAVDIHRVSVYTFCIIESVSDECSYDLGLRASGPRPDVSEWNRVCVGF